MPLYIQGAALPAGLPGQLLGNNSIPSPTWLTIGNDATVASDGTLNVVGITGTGGAIPILPAVKGSGSTPLHFGYTTVTLASDADYTLANSELVNPLLRIASTPSLTTTRNIILPATTGAKFTIYNNTTGGQSITVKASSGAGVTVINGARMLVHYNGTDYVPESVLSDVNIASNAAIAVTKLASGTAGYIVGTGANSGVSKSLRRADVHPSDYGWLAWSERPSISSTHTVLATAGTIYCSRVWVEEAITVGHIVHYSATVGSSLTTGQCFIALWDSSGNLLGQSVDLASTWGSTTGQISTALSGGSVSVPAGFCYVGAWFNGTTGPNLQTIAASGQAMVNGGLTGNNALYATADTGRTTTAPSTLGTRTASNTAYWFVLKA